MSSKIWKIWKYFFIFYRGHATTLPRQRDHVSGQKTVDYRIMSMFAVAILQTLIFFVFFLSSMLHYVVALQLSRLNNCGVPSSVYAYFICCGLVPARKLSGSETGSGPDWRIRPSHSHPSSGHTDLNKTVQALLFATCYTLYKKIRHWRSPESEI